MKTIDKIHTGLVIIFIISYIILCMNVQYKDPKQILDPSKRLTDNERTLLWITNSVGFILSIILSAYEIRYLSKNLHNKLIRIIILIVCLVLILTTFHHNVFTDDPNSPDGKFAYAIIPLLFSIVIIGESSVNNLLIQYNLNSSESSEFDSMNNSSDYDVLD